MITLDYEDFINDVEGALGEASIGEVVEVKNEMITYVLVDKSGIERQMYLINKYMQGYEQRYAKWVMPLRLFDAIADYHISHLRSNEWIEVNVRWDSDVYIMYDSAYYEIEELYQRLRSWRAN